MLKSLRKQVARQKQIPPYVIFQDQSLEAMASVYPISTEELKNIPGVGEGKAKRYGNEFIKLIKKYVEENGIKNVSFTGFYNKQDEPGIIAQATFLNIYYSLEPNPRTAISNRFYNSLIYRKPMITTIGTIQGKYAADYQVGLAVKNTENLACEIELYYQQFDSETYEQQRLKLLQSFRQDYQVFENALKTFAIR